MASVSLRIEEGHGFAIKVAVCLNNVSSGGELLWDVTLKERFLRLKGLIYREVRCFAYLSGILCFPVYLDNLPLRRST